MRFTKKGHGQGGVEGRIDVPDPGPEGLQERRNPERGERALNSLQVPNMIPTKQHFSEQWQIGSRHTRGPCLVPTGHPGILHQPKEQSAPTAQVRGWCAKRAHDLPKGSLRVPTTQVGFRCPGPVHSPDPPSRQREPMNLIRTSGLGRKPPRCREIALPEPS